MKDEEKTKEQLIEELKELRIRIASLKEVGIDELTGLYNRHQFLEVAESEFARARRLGRPLASIILDIDHLTQVNEKYGHAIGDQVLSAVAERCRTNLRYVDILGRYGGEEIVILLPEAELPAANQIAERIRRCIAANPVPTEKGPVKVTISLGVTNLTEDTSNMSSFLERTEKAMNKAKQGGRNRVEVG